MSEGLSGASGWLAQIMVSRMLISETTPDRVAVKYSCRLRPSLVVQGMSVVVADVVM
jgi:hypothetical protein